jgi:hypothetical protein
MLAQFDLLTEFLQIVLVHLIKFAYQYIRKIEERLILRKINYRCLMLNFDKQNFYPGCYNNQIDSTNENHSRNVKNPCS